MLLFSTVLLSIAHNGGAGGRCGLLLTQSSSLSLSKNKKRIGLLVVHRGGKHLASLIHSPLPLSLKHSDQSYS